MLEYGSIWQTATIFISSTFQDMAEFNLQMQLNSG